MNEENIEARKQYFEADSKGILQTIDGYIDAAINTYIFDVSEALTDQYGSVVIQLGALAIIFLVIRVVSGQIESTMRELAETIFRIIIIFAFFFHADEVLRLLYSVFFVWPDDLIQTMIKTLNGIGQKSNTIKGTLDFYFDQTIKLGLNIIENKNIFSDPMHYLVGIVIMIAGFLLSATPLGLIALSKVGGAMLLGLFPVFLIFALFKKTGGFFESWIRSIMTLVFLKLLVFSTMILTIFIIQIPLRNIVAQANLDKLTIGFFMSFFVGAFVMWQFYKHVPGIAATLGSGFTMQASGIVENTAKSLRDRFNKK